MNNHTSQKENATVRSLNTQLVHGGIDGDERTGAVSIPIYQTTTYRQMSLGHPGDYEYSRTGNPTREALEKLIAELEVGTHGFAFASGMAAITAVLFLFSAGDKILISNNVYGGTFRVLDKVFSRFGLNYDIVDTSSLKEVEEHLTEDVKGIFVETPANPLLTITDIRGVAKLAKNKNVLTIVDNTFMTPCLQRPITLGADIVVHSATKYLAGHSDVIAGLVVVNNVELAEKLHFIQNATGGILQPWDSWLTIRGIKTLGIRMEKHQEGARFVTSFLQENPAVRRVFYPGLTDFPGSDIHEKQANGPGAMISFILRDEYDIKRFFENTGIITLAESLGGVESLISHPASMTHASIPLFLRQKVGITDRLIRLSVGIEDKRDVVRSLTDAFSYARM